jgi:hypothetical protein
VQHLAGVKGWSVSIAFRVILLLRTRPAPRYHTSLWFHRLWTSLPRTGSVSLTLSPRKEKGTPDSTRDREKGKGRGGAGWEGVICLSSVGRC